MVAGDLAAGEPFVLGMLFAPEARARLAELGVPDKAAYIAVRSAPMGRADPAVVTAAFHGFPHAMILEVLPGLWELVTPEEVIAAHHASPADHGGARVRRQQGHR